MDPITAGIGLVGGLLGSIFGGGGDNSQLEAAVLQQEEAERQREFQLEMARRAERQQIIAGAQQRQLTQTLAIGAGVVALGAVATAVVVKEL